MGNWDWETVRQYLPVIIIVLIGFPLAYLGGRKPKNKSAAEEKKEVIKK